MKKLFVIILCLLFVFNLSACNDKTAVTSENDFIYLNANSGEKSLLCGYVK